MEQIEIANKKLDVFLILILIIGISVFITEAYFVSKINFIADSAHYADTAENLLQGSGFTLDFLDQYFVKFNSVSHPLEWDYPMMSIIIAPFIYFLGKTAFATKLPTMIIGTILFPILVYYLGKEFFDRKIGVLSAVSVLFYAQTFTLSFNGQRDMPFAFFLLTGIYFFYKGLKDDNTKYFYLMGLFLGLSYLIRPSTLIIFPTVFLIYYLVKKKIELNIIKGMLLGVLIMSPWLLRNFLIFGDPFFTANYYTNWIFGWFPVYEQIGLKVYWSIPKPSFSWIISLPSATVSVYTKIYYKIVVGFLEQFRQLLILNITIFVGLLAIKKRKVEKKLFATAGVVIAIAIAMEVFYVYNLTRTIISDVIFVTLYILPYLAILFIANYKLVGTDIKKKLFIILWIAFALFHSFYAVPSVRYFLPLIPFLFIFSWAGLKRILEFISVSYRNLQIQQVGKILLVFLIIFVLINLPATLGNFVNEKAPYPYQDSSFVQNKMKIADLINKATEKDAVVMTCAASITHFYTGRKIVEVPGDSLEKIVEVMKTYNVGYLSFSWCERRYIDPRLYNIIFAQENPPPNYQDFLFKINLEEVKSGHGIIINIKAVPVAFLGQRFYN